MSSVNLIRGEDVTVIQENIWDGSSYDEYNNPVLTSNETLYTNVVVSFRNSSKEYNTVDYAYKTKAVLYLDTDDIISEDSIFIIRGTKWQMDSRTVSNKKNAFNNQIVNVRNKITVKLVSGYNDEVSV